MYSPPTPAVQTRTQVHTVKAGETAKIVNPSRTVLLPNLMAGCQLADSAPAEDLALRIKSR